MADASEVEIALDSRIEEVKNWLKNEGHEKYKEAKRLSQEESKNDPETEPYKSKYASRNLLVDMKTNLETMQTEGDEFVKMLLAVIDYKLGVNYIETEEASSGEEHFVRCLYSVQPYLNSKCSSLALQCMNQLGILWSQRGEADKALEYLQGAESLYHKYRKEVGGSPYSINEFFSTDEQSISDHNREAEFEAAFTHSLYYLAQVHGALGDSRKSGLYCNTTLQRQLDTKQYDPLDWSLNCATLSQYYITQGNYAMARHCLSCASVVFAEAQEQDVSEPVTEDDGELERQKKEKLPQTKADIARCWVKYCLNLLRDQELNDEGEGEEDQEEDDKGEGAEYQEEKKERNGQLNSGADGHSPSEETAEGTTEGANNVSSDDTDEKNPLRFGSLEVTSYEQSVPDRAVKTFKEARELFLQAQRWLNQAKEFYELDGHVSDYVEIQQDLSQLFKKLAHMETDKERQCKMHKRRVDILCEVLAELNPQHYLQICRQLMFETAEAYSEMVDLKMALCEENHEPPTVHTAKKINHVISQSIKFFQTFIDSMKQKNELPETFDDDIVRPALVSQFCISRLYGKVICSETRTKLDNLKKSLDLYNYLVEYCDTHPAMPIDVFKDELEISREMAGLLPLKMAKIMAETSP